MSVGVHLAPDDGQLDHHRITFEQIAELCHSSGRQDQSGKHTVINIGKDIVPALYLA
jgi:hypothetical protein